MPQTFTLTTHPSQTPFLRHLRREKVKLAGAGQVAVAVVYNNNNNNNNKNNNNN
jgi:hypothetical protein